MLTMTWNKVSEGINHRVGLGRFGFFNFGNFGSVWFGFNLKYLVLVFWFWYSHTTAMQEYPSV